MGALHFWLLQLLNVATLDHPFQLCFDLGGSGEQTLLTELTLYVTELSHRRSFTDLIFTRFGFHQSFNSFTVTHSMKTAPVLFLFCLCLLSHLFTEVTSIVSTPVCEVAPSVSHTVSSSPLLRPM